MSFNPSIMRKLTEWKNNPIQFVKEAIRTIPSEQQIEGLIAYRDGKRITIRSGHGTGKDAFASWIILHFLSMQLSTEGGQIVYPKVVCTAPTGRQLNDILWSELSRWLRGSVFADEFVVQRDKIFGREAPKEWWVRAVSASVKASKEEQAETLAGFHNPSLLFVVDESSGVPDPIYIPLEGAMTQENNRILLIGNMTKNIGYFYDTHYHEEIKRQWIKLHWDSRKSTNVKEGYCEYMRTKYGEDSDVFRIRVAGEPPSGNARTFIPLAWAEQCIGNDIVVPEDEPLYRGIDVARYGDDASIDLPRQGNLIMPWEQYNGINTIDLGGHIQRTFIESDAMGIAIDEIGVGAGVTDWLYKHNLPGLFGVNVARASSDRTKADRLRDELWLRVREKCLQAKYSFPTLKKPGETLSLGQELANELASPLYDFNADGGYVVESKKRMKARGVASPNIADALCLSEYFSDNATKMFAPRVKKEKRTDRWREKLGLTRSRYSWMHS